MISSGAYDRTSSIHLMGSLAAAAENRGRVKKRLENVAIANALQLEAARRYDLDFDPLTLKVCDRSGVTWS